MQSLYSQTLELDLACHMRWYHFTVRCYLPHQPLKGQLPDQQFCGFLVPPDLFQGNCPWSKSICLFDSTFWSLHPTFLCCFLGCCCLPCRFLGLLYGSVSLSWIQSWLGTSSRSLVVLGVAFPSLDLGVLPVEGPFGFKGVMIPISLSCLS